MGDRRDRDQQWYQSFDEKAMALTYIGTNRDSVADVSEEVTIPAAFEVCGTCDGKGHHVNPSIDSHGISPEEFAEDPDFKEDYLSGMYDVPCHECHGRRVVPMPDMDRLSPEQKADVEAAMQAYHDEQAELEHQRKYQY